MVNEMITEFGDIIINAPTDHPAICGLLILGAMVVVLIKLQTLFPPNDDF